MATQLRFVWDFCHQWKLRWLRSKFNVINRLFSFYISSFSGLLVRAEVIRTARGWQLGEGIFVYINTAIQKLSRYIFPWMVALIRITTDVTVWSIWIEVNEVFLVIEVSMGEVNNRRNYETTVWRSFVYNIVYFGIHRFTEHFLEP